MISVIVPVYNVEKYIPECVESILNQTYTDFELLLIDDGSTDSSGNICDYYTQDKRVHVKHKTNGGLVSAWKAGVDLAVGELIAFVDGDDLIEPDYLEELYESMDGNVDMVCSNLSRFWEDGSVTKLRTNFLSPGIYDCDDNFYSHLINNQGSRDKLISNNRVTKLSRTEMVKQCASYCSDEVSFGEDYQMTLCMLLASKKIRVIDSYKYYYRYNPESIVNTYKIDLWERTKKLFNAIDCFPNIRNIPNYEKQRKTELLLYFSNCVKNEYYHGKLNKEEFLNLVTDEVFVDSVRDYYDDNMWKLDKLIISFSKKRHYKRVKFLLYLYRAYCKVRGVHC